MNRRYFMEGRQSSPRSGKKGQSVFRMASENPDLRALDAITTFMSEYYTKQPPELTDVVHEYPHLTKLADHIHNLLATAEEKPLSLECARAAELGMRYLVNEYTQMKETSQQATASLGNAQRLVDYAALLAQNPDDITLAQLQIINLQHENSDLKERISNMQAEVNSIQEENAKLDNENNNLNAKIISLVNNHKNDISKENQRYNRLEDQHQTTVDTIKHRDEDINRLRRLLSDTQEELNRSNRAFDAMKERLQNKNELISKLRTEVRKKEIELTEAKLAHEKAELTMSTEFMSQSRLAEDQSNAAFRKLLRFTHQQSKQIDALTEANRKAADVIERQNQLFDAYEDQLASYTNSNTDVLEQNTALREKNRQLEDDLDRIQQQWNIGSAELEKLRQITNDCINNLAPAYVVTPEGLPEVCEKLAGTRIDEETARILRKLNSTADSLSKFIVKLIRDGTVDIGILKTQSPIVKDITQRHDILSALEETRVFLDQVCYSFAEEEPAAKYLANLDKNLELADEHELPLAEVLSVLLEKQREYNQQMTDELAAVREVLPAFDCKDYELPSAVAQYIILLQPVFKQLLQVIGRTLKYHGNITDIFNALCGYVEESSAMINELDTEVRPLIGYSGKITGIAPKLVEVIAELKELAQGGSQVQSRELTDSMIAADRERVQYERKIDEMDDQIHTQQRMIDSLKKQLENAASELQDIEKDNEVLKDQIDLGEKNTASVMLRVNGLEEENRTLIEERERLQTTIKERQQLYESRLKAAVEKEREVAAEELERERRKHEEHAQEIERQMTALNKKYNREKANVNKTVHLYNLQQEQHQEALQQANREKADLNETIDHIREDPAIQREVDVLHQKLAEARLKNRELIAELSRVQQNTSFASQHSPSKSLSPKSSPTKTRAELKAEEQLVDALGRELGSFLGVETTWTRQRVLDAVRTALQRIEQLEKAQQRSPRKQRKEEWVAWADALLEECVRGYDPNTPEPGMRDAIEEIVRSVRAPSKLVLLVQSLREQKAILAQTAQVPQRAEGAQPTLKDLCNAVCFLTFARNKKTGGSKVVETPPSPVASRSYKSVLVE